LGFYTGIKIPPSYADSFHPIRGIKQADVELEAHSTALQSLHMDAIRPRLVSEIGKSLSQVNELDGAGD